MMQRVGIWSFIGALLVTMVSFLAILWGGWVLYTDKPGLQTNSGLAVCQRTFANDPTSNFKCGGNVVSSAEALKDNALKAIGIGSVALLVGGIVIYRFANESYS